MKESKKPKGTKVKLTKCKRVSLRCPLTIDRTDLEHNYDEERVQICLTVENMGGGGVTNDSIESAIIVIRLYDANGTLVPCTKNEYFAKLLRFGEDGLQSGSQITFRLIPDCDGGLRVENLELYISRVRYADGSVTDYLRGDFFDLPSDGIPLRKKHKKNIDIITAKFGAAARYEPEALTDIIWRCTCGEFCESDACAACGAVKSELFAFFDPNSPSPTMVAGIPLDESSPKSAANESIDPSPSAAAAGAETLGAGADDSIAAAEHSVNDAQDRPSTDQAFIPASDKTTEYDTLSFVASTLGTAQSNTSDDADEYDNENAAFLHHLPPRVKPDEKNDKLKMGLIIAIIASALLLLTVIIILIIALATRGGDSKKSGDETTTQAPIESTVVTDDPDDPDTPADPDSENEMIVRNYLADNLFDSAYGYATSHGCSDELINEVLTAAIEYYTNTEPDNEKVKYYAGLLNDGETNIALNLKWYNEAMASGNYSDAIGYAEALTDAEDREGKLTDAAEALLQAQLDELDFEGAKQTAQRYPTDTTADEVIQSAVSYYTDEQDFDKAIELAQTASDTRLPQTVAQTAVDYYIGEQDYDRAADYVRLTGDSSDIVDLLRYFDEEGIRRNLPLFFPYLSVTDKQAIHASVLDISSEVAVIDSQGNVYLGDTLLHSAAESGKTAVSVKCSELTTVILFSDGTVEAYGENEDGQCNVSGWNNIVAIDAADTFTVGLKADGTVVAVGNNDYEQCNVGQLSNIVAIAAGNWHTLALRSDGTVVAIGREGDHCNTQDWEDIVMISAGKMHSIGLKSDGSVVAAGSRNAVRCDVDDWSDVVFISAGETCSVGLKSNGRLLLVGDSPSEDDLPNLSNVVWIAAGNDAVIALRSSGSLFAIGDEPTGFAALNDLDISTDIYGIE